MSDTMNVITHSVARIGSQTSMPATRYRRRLQVRLGLFIIVVGDMLAFGPAPPARACGSSQHHSGAAWGCASQKADWQTKSSARRPRPAAVGFRRRASRCPGCGFCLRFSSRGAGLQSSPDDGFAADAFVSAGFDSAAGLASAFESDVVAALAALASDELSGSLSVARLRLFSLSSSPMKSVSYPPPPLRRNIGADTSFLSRSCRTRGAFLEGRIGDLLQQLLIELAVFAPRIRRRAWR